MTESTYARQRRDQRTAADTPQADTRDLMCRADYCPNRWSVDGGRGRCCSAHAWASTHRWPEITREQQDAETERAWRQANPPPAPEPMPQEARRAALQELRAALAGADKPNPKAWAHNLRRYLRENGGILPSGQSMTRTQCEACRHVLGRDGEVAAVQPESHAHAHVFAPEGQLA